MVSALFFRRWMVSALTRQMTKNRQKKWLELHKLFANLYKLFTNSIGVGWFWLCFLGVGWFRLCFLGVGWFRLYFLGVGWFRLCFLGVGWRWMVSTSVLKYWIDFNFGSWMLNRYRIGL
ncbi:unnamed protein product [Rhizophagus irregularis]|nr:unnamed protein product [Rhizophagus irregularis]